MVDETKEKTNQGLHLGQLKWALGGGAVVVLVLVLLAL